MGVITKAQRAKRVPPNADAGELGTFFLTGLFALLATGAHDAALLSRYVTTLVKAMEETMNHTVLTATERFWPSVTVSRPTQPEAGQPLGVLQRARSQPVRSSVRSTERPFFATCAGDGPSPASTDGCCFAGDGETEPAERFGVGLGKTYGRNGDENLPPENFYSNSRSTTTPGCWRMRSTFSISPPSRSSPFVMCQFVKTGVFLPSGSASCSWAAEMAGCIMSTNCVASAHIIRRRARGRRANRVLYSEILTDEIGHVGYCASRCTSAERAVMRRIYPLIGRLFARQTAEISLLIDPKRCTHASTDPSESRTHGWSEQRGLPRHTSVRRASSGLDELEQRDDAGRLRLVLTETGAAATTLSKSSSRSAGGNSRLTTS